MTPGHLLYYLQGFDFPVNAVLRRPQSLVGLRWVRDEDGVVRQGLVAQADLWPLVMRKRKINKQSIKRGSSQLFKQNKQSYKKRSGCWSGVTGVEVLSPAVRHTEELQDVSHWTFNEWRETSQLLLWGMSSSLMVMIRNRTGLDQSCEAEECHEQTWQEVAHRKSGVSTGKHTPLLAMKTGNYQTLPTGLWQNRRRKIKQDLPLTHVQRGRVVFSWNVNESLTGVWQVLMLNLDFDFSR